MIHNVVLMSALQPSDSVTRIYTFFSVFSSIAIYHRILNIVPAVLYNRNLWFIHSVLNSLHLLILTSQSFPPRPPPPWQSQVCSLCLVSLLFLYVLCFFFISSPVSYFRSHLSNIMGFPGGSAVKKLPAMQ